MSKKRIVSFLSGVLALSLMVGTWAYYTSENSIDNQLQTLKYGNELVEKFTPDNDWQPGEKVNKKVWVKNTGDYDLFVRIKMDEKWWKFDGPPPDGTIIAIDSKNTGFLPPSANVGNQLSAIDGQIVGDGSVVYKEFISTLLTDWEYNPADGYWYYKHKLTPGTDTGNLLESITLTADIDMGVYNKINYYATDEPPTNWTVYTGSLPNGATNSRSVSVLDTTKSGYSQLFYNLIITSEVLQATKEAFDASTSWSTTPGTVKTAWGVN